MSAQIIDGKTIAARVRAGVAEEVRAFAQEFDGAVPGLATILVGDDPASAVYVRGKHKACEEVGIRGFNFPLAADTSRDELVELVERLNADPEVSGILLQLPLPAPLEAGEMTATILPEKDVDGLTPLSAGLLAHGQEGLVPCTPAGVMELLRHSGTEL